MRHFALSLFESSPIFSFCVPVAASRYLVHLTKESRTSRIGHSLLVLLVAVPNRLWWFVQPDDVLLLTPVAAVMVGSFVQAYLTSDAVGWVTSFPRWMFSSTLSLAIGTCVAVALHFQLIITLRVAAAAAISWGTRTFLLSLHPQARTAAQGILLAAAFTLSLITPLLDSAAVFLFPTRELVDALSTVEAASQVAATTATAGVSGVLTLRRTVYELVFVTICIQVSMGFIGIDYMKAGQIRKLALLSMGPDKGSKENAKNPLTSRLFLKKSGKYILFTALPYMLWRGSMETANTLAFSKMQQQVETDFLHVLFQQTTAGATTNEAEFPSSTVRLQQVASSNYTVSSYTESISDITKTSFSLFSRKCFSVPKMALFPGLFMARPAFVASILPISVIMDVVKGWVSASLTLRARELRKEANVLKSQQQRVQEHDIRNEHQVRLNNAALFTRDRWISTARQIKAVESEASMLESLRAYINWLYWSDMLKVGIDVMISALLEHGAMATTDVMVASRVVEDAIDTLLMRSRAEADLATVATDSTKLHSLVDSWVEGGVEDSDYEVQTKAAVGPPRLVPCVLSQTSPAALEINGLHFKRGHASISMDGLRLSADGNIIAVTGANGCGKSTSFALIAAGSCTERPIELPESVSFTVAAHQSTMALTLPGAEVVTVSQTPYFPLFARPIDWFLAADGVNQGSMSSSCINSVEIPPETCEEASAAETEVEAAARVAALGNDLHFFEDGGLNASTFMVRADDWYGSLSGGQRSKADFIRQVFARKICPSLLLVDEGFAALDPSSKALVQTKLKTFCHSSLVLVIYHTDTASEEEELDRATRSDDTCLQPGFFDGNLHFQDGTARIRPLCPVKSHRA